MQTNPNIPASPHPRIVIAGGGFAGLKLARMLKKAPYQLVLLDKNNYHQFQPLLYQVATAGLEPSSIAFPFRKIFQHAGNFHFRTCEFLGLDSKKKEVLTSLGRLHYDLLVLATGVETNYYGNEHLKKHAVPMKSLSEALRLRNILLLNHEQALVSNNADDRQGYMNVIVVGGGATGVEISGTLAEMRASIFPKDYPELKFNEMKIMLLEGSDRLLGSMTARSGRVALKSLQQLGVEVNTRTFVKDYDGRQITTSDGRTIKSNTVIWAAGVKGKRYAGLPEGSWTSSDRLRVDRYSRVEGMADVFALGDMACLPEEAYPQGHPQVAQAALQQARQLALNFLRNKEGINWKPFHYANPGSLATIGRNKAIAEFRLFRFYGFAAWMLWLFVHLMAIVGVKNRLFIFLNWLWAYVTYDQSLRLILSNTAEPEQGQ